MPTMAEIINRAYRKLGVLAMDEELGGDEAAVGLEALNGMLHEWSLRGVDLSHADLGLADVLPLSDAYRDGVTYMLAARIAPDYSVPAAFDADDFFRAIQAAHMTIEDVSFDRAVTEVPSKAARTASLGYQVG